MAPKSVLRVFLDTSVILAAVLSPAGGARKLFQLAEAGLIKLIVSPGILRECDEVVRRKSPLSMPQLARLLAAGEVETCSPPAGAQLARAKKHVRYLPDAHVLAGAIHAHPDWFVTHDREHFLSLRVESGLSFRIGTPGDLLQALREEFK